jgi:3-dehydroquinate synthetase
VGFPNEVKRGSTRLTGKIYLSKRHISNADVNTIKLAVVLDSKEFAYLESHAKQVFQRDTKVLLHIVTSSKKRKAIVTEDIKDRRHSVGHALETLAPIRLLRGEAVANGVFKEAENPRPLRYCCQETVNRLSLCLSLCGLRTAIPTSVNGADIMRY